MKKKISAMLIIFTVLPKLLTAADEKIKFGATVDLTPFALWAITQKPGGSLQFWGGKQRIRFRIVGAAMHLPDALGANKNFTDHQLTVAAGIIDIFKNKDALTGAWAGTGYELWRNRIEYKGDSSQHSWFNHVATIGCGYIWKFSENFFIEPWGAAHYILNRHEINADNKSYTPQRISGELSLKAGVFF